MNDPGSSSEAASGSGPDVVVLRQKIHGMDARGYADALRARLPDREVVRARTPEAERNLLRRAPVATGFEIAPERLADAGALELFACAFAGTSHLALSAFEEHGVAVTSAAGIHAPNAAEHALAGILALARGFDVAWRRTERREWRSFPTRELAGSTVTVVGLGSIGQAIVDRLDPFDVHAIGVRYTPSKGGPTDEVYGFDAIHDAVTDADYVAVAAPLSEATEGLFDEEVLRTMPADAGLVNVGRGAIVVTDALVAALRTNALRGAVLDVTDPEPLPEDHPLWGLDDVLITPHNAGHTPAYWDRLADLVARNLERAEERGEYEGLENQVV